MPARRFGLLVVFLFHVSPAEAAGLRGQVSLAEAEQSLLAELAGTLRPSAGKDHVADFEAALRPMFAALPHEPDGRLGHAVVRYALHRFFVRRFGWFVLGLEPRGDAQNASSERGLQDLKEWVPSYLQSFLDQLQGGQGIKLRGLAVLAATLEDLVHKEARQRLEKAYTALEVPVGEQLEEARMPQVLEIYLMIYMLGGNFTPTGKASVLRAHNIFTEKLKDWGKLQEWMHEVQKEVSVANVQSVNFSTAALVVEEIGKRYGAFNNKECGRLKSELVGIESQKAGRVRLAEFYRRGLAGVFSFNEKADYLRTLGALDESDSSEPHVIIPNYVSSRPNCLRASSFYVVCCRNECEDFLGALEEKIQAEMAEPREVLSFVSQTSSATGSPPRALSASLVKRLEGIAAYHHGKVPLHGRLFAQWMHHAFPRECPYPHGSRTTSPQTPDEWMQEKAQQDSEHTKEEMQAHVDSDTCGFKPKGEEARALRDSPENELPWDDTEELLRRPEDVLEPSADGLGPASTPHRPMRTLGPVAALSSVASSLAIFGWKMFVRRGKCAILPVC